TESGPEAHPPGVGLHGAAKSLARAERRRTDAAAVDRFHASASQTEGDVSRYPRARLLGDERYPDAPSERADRLERATRAGLPLGLDALLEIVEMDGERVGLDHRDDLRDVARAKCHLAVLLHELRDAEVRDDERARGGVSDHRIRRREHRIADRGAL